MTISSLPVPQLCNSSTPSRASRGISSSLRAPSTTSARIAQKLLWKSSGAGAIFPRASLRELYSEQTGASTNSPLEPLKRLQSQLTSTPSRLKTISSHTRLCRLPRRRKTIRLRSRKMNRHRRRPNGPLFYEETSDRNQNSQREARPKALRRPQDAGGARRVQCQRRDPLAPALGARRGGARPLRQRGRGLHPRRRRRADGR